MYICLQPTQCCARKQTDRNASLFRHQMRDGPRSLETVAGLSAHIDRSDFSYQVRARTVCSQGEKGESAPFYVLLRSLYHLVTAPPCVARNDLSLSLFFFFKKRWMDNPAALFLKDGDSSASPPLHPCLDCLSPQSFLSISRCSGPLWRSGQRVGGGMCSSEAERARKARRTERSGAERRRSDRRTKMPATLNEP